MTMTLFIPIVTLNLEYVSTKYGLIAPPSLFSLSTEVWFVKIKCIVAL